jgi:hypothetical protein
MTDRMRTHGGRGEVDVVSDLTRAEQRSWHLHRHLSNHLTECSLEQWSPTIKRNLQRLLRTITGQPHIRNLERWNSLIEDGDVLGLHRVLTGLDRDSIEMREVSPMSGLLPQSEREVVLQGTRWAIAKQIAGELAAEIGVTDADRAWATSALAVDTDEVLPGLPVAGPYDAVGEAAALGGLRGAQVFQLLRTHAGLAGERVQDLEDVGEFFRVVIGVEELPDFFTELVTQERCVLLGVGYPDHRVEAIGPDDVRDLVAHQLAVAHRRPFGGFESAPYTGRATPRRRRKVRRRGGPTRR